MLLNVVLLARTRVTAFQAHSLMTSISKPLRHDVTIINDLGLHARAAAKLAKVAQQAENDIWLEFDSEQVDAKEVIDILTLAAAKGDHVTIIIENTSDQNIMNQIVELFNNGFGE